jgi:hypothetical protein
VSLDLLKTLHDKENAKYREVTATPGTLAIAVVNPDGSSISAGAGGGSVTQGAGAAAGTFWRVAPDFAELSGLSAGSLNADLLPSTDMSAMPEISLQVLGTWSGTLSIQYSNDNTNFTAGLLEGTSSGSSTQVGTTTANGIYRILRKARYVRVRMTSYSSGTATGVAEAYTSVTGPASGISSAKSGNWDAAVSAGKLSTATSNGVNTTPSLDTSFGSTVSHAAKGSAGNVFSLSIESIDASLVYFQLHNKATAPATSDVPLYSWPIAAGSATVPSTKTMSENFFGMGGKQFSTGISWGISTTNGTYTAASTASNYNVHVHYV